MRALVLAALVAACAPIPPPEPPEPDDCDAAAATIQRLDCAREWGIEWQDGDFIALCRRAERDGPSMCPAAIAASQSCDEAELASTCGE